MGQSLGAWGEPTEHLRARLEAKWSCCWGGRECHCHREDEAPHSGPHLRAWARRAGSREAPGDVEDSRFLGAGGPPQGQLGLHLRSYKGLLSFAQSGFQWDGSVQLALFCVISSIMIIVCFTSSFPFCGSAVSSC